MLDRKQIAEMLGIRADTFRKHYRTRAAQLKPVR